MQTLESNCQMNLITPEKYLAGNKAYLEKQKNLLLSIYKQLDKNNVHFQRIKRRVELVTKEIKEQEEGEDEPQPE